MIPGLAAKATKEDAVRLFTFLNLRVVLAYLFKRKKKFEQVDDESIYDYLVKHIYYLNENDKELLIDVHADASLRAAYGGNIKKLSARSCNYYSTIFNKTYRKEPISSLRYLPDDHEAISMFNASQEMGNKFMRFKGGMKGFIDHWTNFLKKQGVKFIDGEVKKIDDLKPKLTLSNGTIRDFDKVISTVNSNILAKIFPSMTYKIPHNTWNSVNLAYLVKPPMTGFGYLVPSVEQQNIFSCTYNYNLFPKNPPSITIFGQGNSEDLIREFGKHTGFYQDPAFITSNLLVESMPQYEVGHYLKEMDMQYNSPDWLHVGGHSFYHSGVVSCVLRSRCIVEDILESGFARLISKTK